MRTQARSLRERLSDYYGDEGRAQPVRILLEKGSYVPVFRSSPATAAERAPESSVAVLPFLRRADSVGVPFDLNDVRHQNVRMSVGVVVR